MTHAQRISVTTVLYSHRMPSHKDKRPPKTHLISEASTAMALANLAALGAIVENEVGTYSKEQFLLGESNMYIGDPLILHRRGWIEPCIFCLFI